MVNNPPDPPEGRDTYAPPADPGSRSGSDAGPELDRLPPPAFPPGARRSALSSPGPGSDSATDGERAAASDVPGDAIISPDDPIRKRGRGIPDSAFISPDDPLVHRSREPDGRVMEVEQVHRRTERAGQRPPTIHELPYLLDQLAEKLHDSGEGALDVHPEMGHFQAALRAFLRGYLEGSRG